MDTQEPSSLRRATAPSLLPASPLLFPFCREPVLLALGSSGTQPRCGHSPVPGFSQDYPSLLGTVDAARGAAHRGKTIRKRSPVQGLVVCFSNATYLSKQGLLPTMSGTCAPGPRWALVLDTSCPSWLHHGHRHRALIMQGSVAGRGAGGRTTPSFYSRS